MLVLLVRLSVTVVCHYSWVSVGLLSSSSRLVRLNGDSMRHKYNRLALGTERTRLVWGDDQSVLSLRVCWPKSSKSSKSSVRSSRSRRNVHIFQFGRINNKRAKRYMFWAARGIFSGHNKHASRSTDLFSFPFTVTNRVRQGRVLSPSLSAVYLHELSDLARPS